MTTLDSVCNRPEFEGTKFKSKDTMGFADEEYPNMKGDALLRLLPDLAVNRQVLSELSTWVEKQIILDLEDKETIGQG